MQGMAASRAFQQRFCSKTKATPLGRIEPRRITEEEYKRLQWQRYRSKNIAVGLLLLGGVLSVYGYSMYAVSQDPLKLDELQLEEDVQIAKNSPTK